MWELFWETRTCEEDFPFPKVISGRDVSSKTHFLRLVSWGDGIPCDVGYPGQIMVKSDLQPAADEEEQVLVYLLASIVYSHAILDSNSCLIFPSPVSHSHSRWTRCSSCISLHPQITTLNKYKQSNKQLIIILFHVVFFDLGRVLQLRNQGEVVNQTLRIAVLTGTLPAGMYEL